MVIPAGCRAGQDLVVDVSDGTEVLVTVPDGLTEGGRDAVARSLRQSRVRDPRTSLGESWLLNSLPPQGRDTGLQRLGLRHRS